MTCPICGYRMPIRYDPDRAACRGVWVKCKGRKCGKEFEIELPVVAQTHRGM